MWFTLEAVTPDYGARAPGTLKYEFVIEAPPERVFAILSDTEQWTKWFPDMRSIVWHSPTNERNRVGARREVDTKSSKLIEHFTVWDENKRMAFYAEVMSVPLASTFMEDYWLAPHGTNQTKMTWLVHYQLRLFMRPFDPIVRWKFGGMFESATKALQAYVIRTAGA
jgi:ribosome-associated toxin RatA of RatAB toxin-antitoxin module